MPRCREISTPVRLVSGFLSWTDYQTTMSSDSEDDPDYVPPVSQNEGIYACSWFLIPTANGQLRRRLEPI